MKQYSRKIVIRIVIIIVFIIGMAYVCLYEKQAEINEPNQFALLSCYSPEGDMSYSIPLKIEDGILYKYDEDGMWSAVELEGKASQVFSGEHLCVLLEDGSLYYDGMTELPEPKDGENFPLSAAYTVMMAKKTLELNETEPFTAVNENIQYTDARALLASGALIYRSDDSCERYTLPREEIKALSGEFILTEEGNVYYLHTDLSDNPVRKEPELLYDGGDIAAISACETKPSCIGIRENGEALSWVGSDQGWNKTWAYDVSEWKNIVAVQQGFYFAVGLDADGKVSFATDNKKREAAAAEDLRAWRGVTEIAVLGETIAGMKKEGRCLFLDVGEYQKYWF